MGQVQAMGAQLTDVVFPPPAIGKDPGNSSRCYPLAAYHIPSFDWLIFPCMMDAWIDITWTCELRNAQGVLKKKHGN